MNQIPIKDYHIDGGSCHNRFYEARLNTTQEEFWFVKTAKIWHSAPLSSSKLKFYYVNSTHNEKIGNPHR